MLSGRIALQHGAQVPCSSSRLRAPTTRQCARPVPRVMRAAGPNAAEELPGTLADEELANSPLGKLADLFVEAAQPLDADAQPVTTYQLPPDMAAALNRMVTRVASKPPKQGIFCTNCCVPLSGPQCAICGHHSSADAALIAPAVTSVWQQHMSQPARQPTPQQRRRKNRVMDRTALAFDERMLLHVASLPPYPERPERLKAVLTRLEASGLIAKCLVMPSREATDVELERVHTKGLIQALQASSAAGCSDSPFPIPLSTSGQVATSNPPLPASSSGEEGVISADALCSQYTYEAARLAAGTAAEMAAGLMKGSIDNGMAIIRPPGHHATRTKAQSGCYFNNAAVAARAAQAAGAARVMILDWDIHHGHGTQEIFEEDTSVLVVSMHRADEEFYPGTGQVTDVGVNDGEGYTINIPWQDNTVTAADYIQATLHVVLPVSYEFQPDVIIISAGFDAASGDPLGGCAIPPEVFAHMTQMMKGLAPTMLLLEGGYNLDATAKCAEACVRVLLGERARPLPGSWDMSKAGTVALMNAMQVQSEFWPCVHPLSLNGWMTAIREQQEAQAGEGEEGEESEEDDMEASAATLKSLLAMSAAEDKNTAAGRITSSSSGSSVKSKLDSIESPDELTEAEIEALLGEDVAPAAPSGGRKK